MLQTILTTIVIFCALIYAAFRVFRAFKSGADPCLDCKLKKNCQKFGQSEEK